MSVCGMCTAESIYDIEQVHDWAWSIAKSTSSSESESECSKIKKNGCNKLSHMLKFTIAEYLYIKELGSAILVTWVPRLNTEILIVIETCAARKAWISNSV